MMMHNDFHDIKLWAINMLFISISFAPIETFLKILSLLLAIGYTLRRWYLLEKNNKNEN